MGYDRLILKQKDLLNAGLHHSILIADLHTKLSKKRYKFCRAREENGLL
ncbi:hypothetical protein [Heyndrickxia ginsengihumi]